VMSEELTKFENLMRCAANIRTAELAQRRKKFEAYPKFIKAGLYLYNKLENVRSQGFYPKMFAFEILKNEGTEEFTNGNYEDSVRRYEEALCIYRYFKSTNVKWQQEGIDDNNLEEVQETGGNKEEEAFIKSAKLMCYLNIAACNLKMKEYQTSVEACNEALILDPNNVKALYRRARAKVLPINANHEAYQQAIDDLNKGIQIDPQNSAIKKELKRLESEIKLISKREKETYIKMFKDSSSNKGEDWKEQKDQEGANGEKQKFSFEIADSKKTYPEIEEINNYIKKGDEMINMYMKTGRLREANVMRERLVEVKKSKDHLEMVMNLDFSKPTPKMREMAEKLGVDLKDPSLISEFKKLQENNLQELRGVFSKGKKSNNDPVIEEIKEEAEPIIKEETKIQQSKKAKDDKSKETKDFEKIEETIAKALREKEQTEGTFKSLKSDKTMIIGLISFFVIWFGWIMYNLTGRASNLEPETV